MFVCFYMTSTLEQKVEKRDLLTVLCNVTHEWRIIGVMLDIKDTHLKRVEKNPQLNDAEKLSEVLQFWLDQKGCMEVSWKIIISVIEIPPLDNKQVANEIRKFLSEKYNSNQQGIHSQ